MTPGNVVDSDTGKVLGTHKGIQGFTVGQTKGLGISSPSKLYVLRLNKGTNEVVVSHNPPETREFRTRKGFNWLSSPQNHANLVCKVRYRSDFVPVEIVSWFDDDTMVFRFKGNANKGNVIAPGQVIAVWEGSRLLGGGIIESAVS
jgi:tRNA-specific 2-thiouridylase